MSWSFPLDSCFRCILRFSMLKASVDLPRLLWLYVLILYPIGFPSRSKCPPLDILKDPVTTLRNQDKKVAFIWVDEDGALAKSSEFMKSCHTMNIISSLDGKSEISNKTLANITIALLLKSIYKKELCCFYYNYAICPPRQTDNRFRGDANYFLWYGTRYSYKHIEICIVRVYIINEVLQ